MQLVMEPHNLNTLEDWLSYCERLHPKTIDLGLDRVREVANRMGIRFTCPVITVAGTNGKGSTCAMLDLPHSAMLMSISLWMISSALVTPASPIAPRP